MPEDLSVLEGPYLRDILDQPAALARTLETLDRPKDLLGIAARLRKGKFPRIVLTGMGSSFHALHPLYLQLINRGYTSLMVETSELLHYQKGLLDPRTLMVAVSQSGQSVEMVRLLRAVRKRCTVIAVTNTPESPLARLADAVLLTQSGPEFSVSCKTYVTALMQLAWLGALLCDGDLRRTRKTLQQAAPAAAKYLAHWQEFVPALSTKLRAIRHLFLVGRGPSLAAVGTAALIVKESDHFHAEGMSSAAFRHGPLEMLGEDMFVLVFEGEARTRDLNRGLVHDIRGRQKRAEIVGHGADAGPFHLPEYAASIGPISEILPAQMITLALAAQAGREPGRFESATKVTTKE